MIIDSCKKIFSTFKELTNFNVTYLIIDMCKNTLLNEISQIIAS